MCAVAIQGVHILEKDRGGFRGEVLGKEIPKYQLLEGKTELKDVAHG